MLLAYHALAGNAYRQRAGRSRQHSHPVQAQYLSAKSLEQFLQTINKVRRQIDPKLEINGILLTMVDSRTNYAKGISALLRNTYGSTIPPRLHLPGRCGRSRESTEGT